MSVNSSVVGTCVIDGDTVSAMSAQSATSLVDFSVIGETGGTGYLDGVPTVGLPIPTLKLVIISGSSALYELQVSSLAVTRGVVQPLDNSTLRWIQVG